MFGHIYICNISENIPRPVKAAVFLMHNESSNISIGCSMLPLQVVTASSVSGSFKRPPRSPAWLSRGLKLLHTCQKWCSKLLMKTNGYLRILMAGAGGRTQDWRPRDAPVTTSTGSHTVWAPAGRDVRTPTAEVINRYSDSHVTSGS